METSSFPEVRYSETITKTKWGGLIKDVEILYLFEKLFQNIFFHTSTNLTV